jgi:hypothetical protein
MAARWVRDKEMFLKLVVVGGGISAEEYLVVSAAGKNNINNNRYCHISIINKPYSSKINEYLPVKDNVFKL